MAIDTIADIAQARISQCFGNEANAVRMDECLDLFHMNPHGKLHCPIGQCIEHQLVFADRTPYNFRVPSMRDSLLRLSVPNQRHFRKRARPTFLRSESNFRAGLQTRVTFYECTEMLVFPVA